MKSMYVSKQDQPGHVILYSQQYEFLTVSNSQYILLKRFRKRQVLLMAGIFKTHPALFQWFECVLMQYRLLTDFSGGTELGIKAYTQQIDSGKIPKTQCCVKIYFYLFASQSKGTHVCTRENLPSLLKWLQWSVLVQAEAKDLEFYSGLLSEWQVLCTWATFCCFPHWQGRALEGAGSEAKPGFELVLQKGMLMLYLVAQPAAFQYHLLLKSL